MESSGLQVLDEKLWEMHLTRQFGWTISLRHRLYDKVDLKNQKLILDCGCGIGLITKELAEVSGGAVHGIDTNGKLIKIAKEKYPEGLFDIASMEKIPFEDNYFDVVFCHFVLMWVKNPEQGMAEMKRVTKPGGWIVAASEPDYGAKIDYPDDYNAVMSTIRQLQAEGSDPFFGRKLKATFSHNGLKAEIGVDCDLWDDEKMKEEFEHVWKFSQMAARSNLQKQWLENVKMRDQMALEQGERVTLLPRFWGVARKEQ